MKSFFSFAFLNLGFVITGFAQNLENPASNTIPLRSVPKSIQPQLELPSTFSLDMLLFDSTKVFRPEVFFQEKHLKVSPPSSELFIPGIYPLPDPQSRMPIKTFDDSVNYTILRKEYR
jgi:hypothetical protein